jgi:FMN phosphatase YigB (HAD superfamily)
MTKSKEWTEGKRALLLDMNGTFVFGHDRFSTITNYHDYYYSIGGTLDKQALNQTINTAYHYLDERYPLPSFRHAFPSVKNALLTTSPLSLPRKELELLIDTFTYHELGSVPDQFIEALTLLSQRYTLGVVADIWSPKQSWLNLFEETGISSCFAASSFSSDHGIVKPAKEPFEKVLQQLGFNKEQALVIGDSPRRDLGGAVAAGIDCVLVGGATDEQAIGCCPSLLDCV